MVPRVGFDRCPPCTDALASQPHTLPLPMASKTVPRRAALKLVQFGTSDMMVTEVCGGTMTWGSFNDKEARPIPAALLLIRPTLVLLPRPTLLILLLVLCPPLLHILPRPPLLLLLLLVLLLLFRCPC